MANFSYDHLISLPGSIRRVERHAKSRKTARAAIFAGLACLALLVCAQPGFANAELQEAQDLMAKKKWAEAAIVLRGALRLAPDSAAVSLDLAKALTFAGKREEALSILTHAASRSRAGRQGEFIRRSRVLSRAFLTNTTFQVYQEGVNLISAKKYRAARERFERALEQEPDNVEILTRIGQCWIQEGDYNNAVEKLKLARKLSPYEWVASLWLGRAMHRRGEVREAVEALRGAYQGLPESELAPVWLAEALVASNQKSAAIQLLEKDIKTKPFHLSVLVTLARLKYGALGRDNGKEAQNLWAVRKDLQVALSRLDRYSSADFGRTETDLGLSLRDPEDLKTEIQILLERVESRLKGAAPVAGT